MKSFRDIKAINWIRLQTLSTNNYHLNIQQKIIITTAFFLDHAPEHKRETKQNMFSDTTILETTSVWILAFLQDNRCFPGVDMVYDCDNITPITTWPVSGIHNKFSFYRSKCIKQMWKNAYRFERLGISLKAFWPIDTMGLSPSLRNVNFLFDANDPSNKNPIRLSLRSLKS